MITVIIGKSASGKTTLLEKLRLENPDASVYKTDDYIPYGFEEAVYVMLRDLKKDTNPNIFIEGVQVPRLLRKGLEQNSFKADKIIICQAHDYTRRQRHRARGSTEKQFVKRDSFDKMVMGIFQEYIGAVRNKPVIEYYNT